MIDEVDIQAIGRHGDGMTEDGRFVPLTLPGERVAIDRLDEDRLVEVLEPSADRIVPPCPHFGRCGGCALQHWGPGPYRAWKREQVVAALAGAGIETDVDPLHAVAPHTRRRVVLAARPTPRGILLGFHARASHDLLDIDACTIATPFIVKRLPLLRAILARLRLRKEARVTVLDTGDGLDVAVEGARPPQAGPALSRMTDLCRRGGVVRLTVEGEALASWREPLLEVGEATAFPPPAAFVQAVRTAEDAMAQRVLDIAGSAKDVIELHAGIGTFTLRLAGKARVTAYESDAAAVRALDRALRSNPGIRPSRALRRDIAQAPLAVDEMKRADALVLDPPRAGAAAQMPSLAASRVARVAYVSCNPATFARDAATLVAGGLRLARVTPLDQFLFSPHIELVGCFTR